MFAWFWRGFYRRAREADIEILWPSIRDLSPNDLDTARRAFAVHVSMDNAWRQVGARESKRIIEGLK